MEEIDDDARVLFAVGLPVKITCLHIRHFDGIIVKVFVRAGLGKHFDIFMQIIQQRDQKLLRILLIVSCKIIIELADRLLHMFDFSLKHTCQTITLRKKERDFEDGGRDGRAITVPHGANERIKRPSDLAFCAHHVP